MKIAIIDNYDSFTYNLFHLVRELGADVDVFRNDRFALPQLATYDRLILSPGPGIPAEAGQLLDVIRMYAPSKPILGVCLGHQALGEYFGAKLLNLSDVFHGVQSTVTLLKPDDYLFRGLPAELPVGRYHSWVVAADALPDCLEVIAESQEGQVMALRHKTLDLRGVQFHPESVLTPEGRMLLHNFLTHK